MYDIWSGFPLSVVKKIPKCLLRPVTEGANSKMNKPEFVVIPFNLLKEPEKSRLQVAIGLGFPFNWLINWHEISKPITARFR